MMIDGDGCAVVYKHGTFFILKVKIGYNKYMQIQYNQYRFNIHFSEPVEFETYPLFIVRSILGKELRCLCCVAKQNECESCLFRQTCAYSWIFETILDKNNSALPGRERGQHPWSLKLDKLEPSELVFTITLLGKANDYLPYVYAALKRGEEKGIGKNRIPYSIDDVICDEVSLLSDDGNTIASGELKTFTMNTDCQNKVSIDYYVRLVSPLRFAKDGRYCKRLEASQFFPCINRRIRTIISLYGESLESEEYSFSKLQFDGADLHYQEMKRWSSRQKKVQNLGGIIGEFHLKDSISLFEESLLSSAELFGAGKLTNFGLGQIEVIREKRW